MAGSRAAHEPEVIVWPEGMVNDAIEDGYPDTRYYRVDPRLIRARIAAKLGPLDTALIAGNALFFDRNGVVTGAGNSIWPLDPGGVLGERYDKAQEYLLLAQARLHGERELKLARAELLRIEPFLAAP